VRVSDDPKQPAGDGVPPVPRPRPSRRKAAQRRDWLRPAQATPAFASERVLYGALAVIALVGLALFVSIRFRAAEPDTTPLGTASQVKTGTSAAAIAAAAKDRDEKRALAEQLFGADLFEVKDWEDLAEEPQWRKAVEVMASLDPKFVEDHLSCSLNLNFDEVMKRPSEFRGRFVRMRGVVGRKFWGAKKLDKPIAGRVDVYRGQVSDPEDDSPIVFFDVLDKPAEFQPGYDGVEIDAMFYRTVTFESRDGKLRKAPWIVGRTVTVKNASTSTAPGGLGPAALTAFLVLGIGIVYLVRRGRPAKAPAGVRPAGFRDMFDRKIKPERREEPPPPPPRGE
jgi:hypothetical protein